MGIHELKELVMEVEDNAKKRKLENIRGQLEHFENTCVRAIAELKEEILTIMK